MNLYSLPFGHFFIRNNGLVFFYVITIYVCFLLCCNFIIKFLYRHLFFFLISFSHLVTSTEELNPRKDRLPHGLRFSHVTTLTPSSIFVLIGI